MKTLAGRQLVNIILLAMKKKGRCIKMHKLSELPDPHRWSSKLNCISNDATEIWKMIKAV